MRSSIDQHPHPLGICPCFSWPHTLQPQPPLYPHPSPHTHLKCIAPLMLSPTSLHNFYTKLHWPLHRITLYPKHMDLQPTQFANLPKHAHCIANAFFFFDNMPTSPITIALMKHTISSTHQEHPPHHQQLLLAFRTQHANYSTILNPHKANIKTPLPHHNLSQSNPRSPDCSTHHQILPKCICSPLLHNFN